MDPRHNAPPLVFVSHHRTDTWIAKQIARVVEERGASVYLAEKDVQLGADFEEQLRDALNRASELVVLLTPWALARLYVWAELGVAWGRRIPIVGLLLGIEVHELQGIPEIPLLLKRAGLLELNQIDRYLAQLTVRVEASAHAKE
ncbi:MAG TPA: toll/interleukin-1 receptor domain-containing protein [Longimicrobium sp.]|nr:toll/interleukin-1 receptor domain-containing protein [Longimicrobium sp.]